MFIPHEEMLIVVPGGKKRKDRVHITQVIRKFRSPALNRFAAPSSVQSSPLAGPGKYDANKAVASRITPTATITQKSIPVSSQ
jgi:hypothetical protein